MIYRLGLLMLVFSTFAGSGWSALAATSENLIIETTLERESTVPGRSAILRITVLVPTWMPEPPVLPSFDLPNLLVRLPERATRPTSKRVNYETWSGLTRAYYLYPMAEGEIILPAETISVIFSDPETREPVRVDGKTDPVKLLTAIPEQAADLDPFIAATRLTLDQSIEGDLSDLKAGDAIERQVTMNITGASPVVLPPLFTEDPVRGLSVYRRAPRLIENIDGEALAGSRTERVSYVVEAGGNFRLPAAQIRWFNLQTGEIEVAAVESISVAAEGPGLSVAKELEYWGETILCVGLLIIVAGGMLGAAMHFWPGLVNMYRQRRAAYLASEKYAFKEAQHALEGYQFGPALAATQVWWWRFSTSSKALPRDLADSFRRLAKHIYGPRPRAGGPTKTEWSEPHRVLKEDRRQIKEHLKIEKNSPLPALNPSSGEIQPRPVPGAQM